MIDITGYDRKRQVRADSDTACDPDLEKYRIKTEYLILRTASEYMSATM